MGYLNKQRSANNKTLNCFLLISKVAIRLEIKFFKTFGQFSLSHWKWPNPITAVNAINLILKCILPIELNKFFSITQRHLCMKEKYFHLQHVQFSFRVEIHSFLSSFKFQGSSYKTKHKSS